MEENMFSKILRHNEFHILETKVRSPLIWFFK